MMRGSFQICSDVLTRIRCSPFTLQVTQMSYGSPTSSIVMMHGPRGPKPGAFFAVQNRDPDATSRFCVSRQVRSFRIVIPAT